MMVRRNATAPVWRIADEQTAPHLSMSSCMRVRNCWESSAAMAACTDSASTTTRSEGACSASNSEGSSRSKCASTCS